MTGEWVPGTVATVLRRVQLHVGQTWRFRWRPFEHRPFDDFIEPTLRMKIAAVHQDGEVVLRPLDLAEAAEFFPPEEHVKGEPCKCPFRKVDQKTARPGNDRGYQAGDLLAHEAWGLWQNMEILYNEFGKPV